MTDTSRNAVQDAMSFISAHMGSCHDGLFVADVLDGLQTRAETAEAERDALQAEVDRLRALGLAANAEWGSWVEDQWSGTSLFDEGAAQVEKNRAALEERP